MFIQQELGLHPSYNPILYKLSQVLFLGVEALAITPIEMARKRLFVQRLNHVHITKKTNITKAVQDNDFDSSAFDTCINVSQHSYSGMLDCLKSVANTEAGKPKSIAKPSALSETDWRDVYGGSVDSNSESNQNSFYNKIIKFKKGIASVYRGFWPRYLSMVILFVGEEMTREEF
jgi:hypothetical protein